MLKTRGFNHIDLGTKDMEATRAFYEDVLGFPLVRADLVEIGDEGVLKHYFFDIGNGQLMGFMSGEDVNGYPKEFDAGINKGLGLDAGRLPLRVRRRVRERARAHQAAPAGRTA